MSFAQGSRSQLAYVVEAVYGTTPVTPSMIELPINTHSLSMSKEVLTSEEIRSDRMTTVSRHGARQVGGDITVEFRADDYDDFLESAMFSTFNVDSLIKTGTTLKSLTLEDGMLDVTQYRTFTGCVVNTFSMSLSVNSMVTATFGMVGKDGVFSGTPLDADITEASGNDPYDGNNFIATIKEGGSTIATVSSLEFTLDNGINPTFVLGSNTTPQLEYGRADISGTLTAYFEDLTLINKFINETESSLEFQLDDNVSGNIYKFLFPKIKYNGGDLPLENEQSRILSMPFIALRDEVEETNLLIQKI